MEQSPVLLIEDDKDLSDALRDGLLAVGISTLQAFDADEGLTLALEKSHA